MIRRLRILLGLLRDPGERWAQDVLAPLRRARADLDVAAPVMARLRSATPRMETVAVAPARPRAVLATTLVTAPVLAAAIILLVTSGDGFFELWNTATALGHAAWVMLASAVQFCGRMLSSAAPLGRAVLRLVEKVAPILRGAGLVAAAWGLLSILFSFYVFAQARRNSSAGHHGGL